MASTISPPVPAADLPNGDADPKAILQKPTRAFELLQQEGDDVRSLQELLDTLQAKVADIQERFSQKQNHANEILNEINEVHKKNEEATVQLDKTHRSLHTGQLRTFCDEKKESENDKQKLNSKIEKLTSRLTEAEKKVESLTGDREIAYSKIENLNSDMQELRVNLERATNAHKDAEQRAAANAKELQKSRKRVSELETSQRSCSEQITSLNDQLDMESAELKELQSRYRPLDKNLPEGIDKTFKKTCAKLFSIVATLMDSDMQIPTNSVSLTWSDFVKEVRYSAVVPLYPSNSPNAKLMRLAAVAAYIAHRMSSDIMVLTPFVEGDSQLRKVLINESDENSGRELLLRAVLTSVQKEEQSYAIQIKIDKLVFDVVRIVGPLLAMPEPLETFKAEFSDALKILWDLWSELIVCEPKVENDCDAERYPHWEWRTYSDRRVAEPSKNEKDKGMEIVAVLFPRIYVMLAEDVTPILPGVVLRHWQTAQATHEEDKLPPTSPTTPKKLTFPIPNKSRPQRQVTVDSESQWSQVRRDKAFLDDYS